MSGLLEPPDSRHPPLQEGGGRYSRLQLKIIVKTPYRGQAGPCQTPDIYSGNILRLS